MNKLLSPESKQRAPFPQSYEEAKNALAACDRLDECKEWSDKAQALSSYAKMADDDELFQMATRIKARAIRRCGELLNQIDGRGGQNLPNPKSTAADTFSQRQAAEAVGMSKRQQVTAVRVANVSDDEFEAAIEAERPATVTKLAEMGRKPLVDLKGRDPKEFNQSMHFIGNIDDHVRYLAKLNIEYLTSILTIPERARLRSLISKIDNFNDQIVTRI